ncbi:CMRF35-like molecule 6 isoform X5 [Phacochoerus africanus]|uniref:CMRF35-like molecule 6 isoform X5 n=1 Tax=Phacochoerus africanus TaxID=41426 RepID=UPI001FDA0B8D|nr:CMRF35-like molecule 6 isoform X5 [Phacochoerus africanus]
MNLWTRHGPGMFPQDQGLPASLPSRLFRYEHPRDLKWHRGGDAGGEVHVQRRRGGYRKFLCRGPDRRHCVRVIETAPGAGQEVRRGRVTLKDSPSEHMFLVVMKDLEVGDADTYWCAVDKNVPQVPVAVTVFPGSGTAAVRTTELSASMGSQPLTGHVSSPGLPAWLLVNIQKGTPIGLKMK